MVSSTFTDLQHHRAALVKALDGQGFKAVVMENDSAKPDIDVIDSSLQMVADASAYIGVISRKYGQTPVCATRNPHELSITELEFIEAQRLNRPILLFIMGEEHLVRERDIESDLSNKEKLNAFRERAKRIKPDSQVHRVYTTFNSLEDFTAKAIQSVADLRRYREEACAPGATPVPAQTTSSVPDPIPTPPAFYAEPRHIGSHKFVGRQAQLDVLNDWAVPADTHPVIFFDAIGGSGKSMLTWEWTTNYAGKIRSDWAGIFWYSFYERGASMADFCRHALGYITRQPPDSFTKMKTAELGDRLLHHLQSRSWLFILDGLERVLVAYQRFDAGQVADDETKQPTDTLGQRDPCDAIRPEENDLLRAFAAGSPSKLVLTSRLVPRALLNSARNFIPAVLPVVLPGLRPADAEELLRNCGITGNSQAIQDYLKTQCDCHPLVTGVLAGLINDYLPARGNFDAWLADSAGGSQLNLANLDLAEKRNNILQAGINSLPAKSRQLLSILALLPGNLDYPTLRAFNPHLPLETQPKAPNSQVAERELANTVRDLEHRGLLQNDSNTKRWDLHPVVRGIVTGSLLPEEIERYGQRVVDHLSALPHTPYHQAQTLGDLRDGLHIVRTLLKMGRYQEAAKAYAGDLAHSLLFNLEANEEALSVLRPFFLQGWATLPSAVDTEHASALASLAAVALENVKQFQNALAAYGAALKGCLQRADWTSANTDIRSIAENLRAQNRLAQQNRWLDLSLKLATLGGDNEAIFMSREHRFAQLSLIGERVEAKTVWDLLDRMGRNWSRAIYRPGDAEYHYALFCFRDGSLKEEQLAHAEKLARDGNNSQGLRLLQGLRGTWRLERGEWELAAAAFRQALNMAAAVHQTDEAAQTQLNLALFRLDQLANPHDVAEQLANASRIAPQSLAELWFALGDAARANRYAVIAYKWAWADGEPFVHRYDLARTRALLEKLGVEIPNLPPYDPAKDPKLPWEDEVAAAIEKLRAEKEAKNGAESATTPF
jgi:tetratricopeptide (TPR) repeat protein